jgi:hypothetical protein
VPGGAHETEDIMSCLLRVAGRSFDVDAYLARPGRLAPLAVFRRGEPRFRLTDPKGGRHQRSGLNVVVSERDFDDFAGQVKHALRFLSTHGPAIRALVKRRGVETAALDFGIERRADALVQVDVFPAALALQAGKLGLALHMSHYPPQRRR